MNRLWVVLIARVVTVHLLVTVPVWWHSMYHDCSRNEDDRTYIGYMHNDGSLKRAFSRVDESTCSDRGGMRSPFIQFALSVSWRDHQSLNLRLQQ